MRKKRLDVTSGGHKIILICWAVVEDVMTKGPLNACCAKIRAKTQTRNHLQKVKLKLIIKIKNKLKNKLNEKCYLDGIPI